MASADFYTAAGEGRAYRSNQASWAAAHDTADAEATDATCSVRSSFSSTFYFIHRLFLPFDTTTIPLGSTINSATLKLYRDDSEYGFANNQTTSLVVVDSTQASQSSLATTDYDNLATTSGGSATFASTSNGSYVNITLNATGLGWIVPGGYSTIAVRSELDRSNTSPGGDNSIGFQKRSQTNKPTLTIDYTPPEVGGFYYMSQ